MVPNFDPKHLLLHKFHAILDVMQHDQNNNSPPLPPPQKSITDG